MGGDEPRTSRLWLWITAAGILVVAAITIATALGETAVLPGLTVVSAVLAAALTLYERVYRTRQDEKRAERERAEEVRQRERVRTLKLESILAAWPLPQIGEVDPYKIGVFHSTIADKHWKGKGSPGYVSRTIDEDLDSVLRTRRLVVVAGDPKAGKSRTLFEAVRRACRGRKVIVLRAPVSGGEQDARARPLLELIDLDPAIPEAGDDLILWLDDAHLHLARGHLRDDTIHRLLGTYPGLIIAATIHESALFRHEAIDKRSVNELRGAAIYLQPRLNDEELDSARRIYPALGQDAGFRWMGEFFAAVDELKKRYRGSRAEHPEGVAVAKAAMDWQRAGMQPSIHRQTLVDLSSVIFSHEIRRGLTLTPDRFHVGLKWAMEQVESSAALLEEIEGSDRTLFRAFDAMVEWARVEDAPVEDHALRFVMTRADPEDWLRIATTAGQLIESDQKDQAMRILEVLFKYVRPGPPKYTGYRYQCHVYMGKLAKLGVADDLVQIARGKSADAWTPVIVGLGLIYGGAEEQGRNFLTDYALDATNDLKARVLCADALKDFPVDRDRPEGHGEILEKLSEDPQLAAIVRDNRGVTWHELGI